MKDSQDQDKSWIANAARGAAFTIGAIAGAVLITKSVKSREKLSLKDKVILITGGGRGLGIVLARKLSEYGATIVICGRSSETLQKASAELTSKAKRFMAVPCDITDKSQVSEMVREIKREVGSVDVLINNAGIITVGPVETMDQEDYEEAMNTHFWGPFNLIKKSSPI